MLIVLDEDLPRALADVFQARGFKVQRVKQMPELRGQPDEVIFDYAVRQQAILATADLDIPNPHRFPLHTIMGIALFRFPNEMPVSTMCEEVKRLITPLHDSDFRNLIVIEPGILRIRSLSHPYGAQP